MAIKLNYKNLFNYLINAAICQKDDLDDLKVDVNSKTFHWLIELTQNQGKLFVKQLPHSSTLDNDIRIYKEWHFYNFLQSYKDLEYASSLTPEVLHFDDSNSLLIYKCPNDYITLQSSSENQTTFPNTLAELVGTTLAKLHSQTMSSQRCYTFLTELEECKLNYQLPYPDYLSEYLVSRFEPDSLKNTQALSWRFLGIFQQTDTVREVVTELVLNHRHCCLTHNNIQFNKIFIPNPGYRIIKQEADGSLATEFDGMILHIQRERHLPSALQSATVNDPVAVLLPSSFIHGNRYRANGDGIGGLPPLKFHSDGIIVYFNFSPEVAVWAMKYLTTKLNAIKVPFGFEVLHNPLNYRLYNSGFLKFPFNPDESYRYKEILLPVLQTIYAENKSHFREQVPIFTKVLAPGIGLAEHPASELKFGLQQQFGENRCEIVANAMLEAHQNGDESKEARMKYIIQHFERLGLDIERPYLNPNSEDIYTPLE